MAIASPEMISLVEELLDDRDLRKRFHDDPIAVMGSNDLDDATERAILFSMDRRLIGAATGLGEEIAHYQMESDWSAQGADWKAGDHVSPEPSDDGTWQAVETPGGCAADAPDFIELGGTAPHGGWSDPHPHGRGMRPSRLSLGGPSADAVQLTLVGEGYLGSACVYIVDEDGGLKKAVPAQEILFKNFRRVYIRTVPFSIAGWDKGRYSVRVQNFDDARVPPIRAGQFLRVEA